MTSFPSFVNSLSTKSRSQIGIRLQCHRNVESVVIIKPVTPQHESFQWRIRRQEARDASVTIRFDTVVAKIDFQHCAIAYSAKQTFHRRKSIDTLAKRAIE